MTPRFCKDCRHYVDRVIDPYGDEWRRACLIADIRLDPIKGEMRFPQYAEIKNKRCDCGDWTPINGERIQPDAPPPEPKRAWWRRLFRTDRERLFDATREVMRGGLIERARTLPIIPTQSTDSGPRTQGE